MFIYTCGASGQTDITTGMKTAAEISAKYESVFEYEGVTHRAMVLSTSRPGHKYLIDYDGNMWECSYSKGNPVLVTLTPDEIRERTAFLNLVAERGLVSVSWCVEGTPFWGTRFGNQFDKRCVVHLKGCPKADEAPFRDGQPWVRSPIGPNVSLAEVAYHVMFDTRKRFIVGSCCRPTTATSGGNSRQRA